MPLNWTVIGLTLAFLLCFGGLYALAVRWMARNLIEGQTAYLVVLGTLVTLLASALIVGWQPALLTLACFAASGLPMVIEYVHRTSEEHRRDQERATSIARDLL